MKSRAYDLPPREGMVITQVVISADVPQAARFCADVLGGAVVREGEPTIVALENAWVIINVGGGPTDDKPSVTLQPPTEVDTVSTFMNIFVADISACYVRWKALGATFLTEPKDGESGIRCFMRDPDGNLIQVGQSKASV